MDTQNYTRRRRSYYVKRQLNSKLILKKISFVIPTLNREKYLQQTLSLLIPQIERNKSEVELVICNNSSDDGTDELGTLMKQRHPFIKYHKFDDTVGVDKSIVRSANLATSEYLIIWGDDDLPLPFAVENLLEAVKKFPEVGLFYMNRLVGYDDSLSLRFLSVEIKDYEEPYVNYEGINNLLGDHFLSMTFITSIFMKRDCWLKGLSYNTEEHYGYSFFAKQCFGVQDRACVMISSPICIQRKVKTKSWMKKWPQYYLLGIPNMISDMENSGIWKDGMKIWYEKHLSLKIFLYSLLCASAHKSYYRPLCKDISSYQKGWVRKFLVYFVIFLSPVFLFDISRNIIFKSKK